MVQVFISYSRRDAGFVRRLAAALAEGGRDVWVDWEDIPPSAKWRAEIAANIESAEAFVFVLSPDSIASEVCTWELDQALQNNKRLIPVVCRDAGGSIHEALRERNWIFFRDSDPFDLSLESLTRAIETDLEWLQMHTRVLVRAHEWERGGGDAGFLLRGLDLEQALRWRLGEAGKTPPPTPLHSRYILASQDAQLEEERRWKALYERAEQQRKRALSRQLALQSIAITGKRLDLALLLALLACRQDDTVEARSALLNAITISPFLTGILRGAHDRVPAAVLSPDGRLVAHTTPAREVLVWSTETRRPLFTLTPATQPLALAFMPDNLRLAIGTESGDVVLSSMELPRQTLFPIAREEAAVTAVAFDRDGKRLATGTSTGAVALWDIESKTRRALSVQHEDAVTGLCFDDAGERLASASKDRQAWLSTLTEPDAAPVAVGAVNMTVHTEDPLRVTFDRRLNRFISAEYRSLAFSGEPPGTPADYPETITSVAASPNGETLVFGDGDGRVGLWDLLGGQRIGRTLDLHNDRVNDVAFHPDGMQMMSASSDGAVALWSLSPPDPYAWSLRSHVHLVYSAAFTPDGRSLISASKASIVIWDVATRAQLGEPILDLGNSATTVVAVAPSGRMFAASHITTCVALYDLESREMVRILTLQRGRYSQTAHGDSVTGIEFTADEQMLAAVSYDGTLAVWTQTESGLEARATSELPKLYTLAVHPREHVAAVAGEGGTVHLFDLDTLQPIGAPLAMADAVYRVTFSPDGRLLAAGTARGVVQFWDWREGRPFGEPIVAHADRIYAAEFHPDGSMFATGGPDGAVLLWDVQTQQAYTQRLHAHGAAVYAIAFSRDGRMASCSEDCSVILWDMNYESWQSRAKAIANRNLTPQEWRRYMGDEPYGKLFDELP